MLNMTPEEKKELEQQLGGLSKRIPKKNNALNITRSFQDDVDAVLGKDTTVGEVDKKQDRAFVELKEQSQANKSEIKPPKQDIIFSKKNKAVGVMHTYKDDLQGVVRKKKVSMVKIAAMEAEKEKIVEVEKQEVEKSYTIAIISLVLILLGVLSIGGVYFARVFNDTKQVQIQKIDALFFVENRQRYDITNRTSRDLKIDLLRIRNNSRASLGSIEQILLTKEVVDPATEKKFNKEITAVEFLDSLGTHTSSEFKRALSDKFFVGLNVIDAYVPVLVLKVEAYGSAFTGMLEWEKNIEADLYPFFNMVFEGEKNATASGTNVFTDVVLENHDVRLLRDSKDRIRMVYSFLDRETIVITGSPHTLLEVRDRLRAR